MDVYTFVLLISVCVPNPWGPCYDAREIRIENLPSREDCERTASGLKSTKAYRWHVCVPQLKKEK